MSWQDKLNTQYGRTTTKTVQPTLTFTPIPILTSTPSPTRELSATPVILKAPDQIEGSIEYAQEYYGISCGFTIIIHDLGNLPLKYEISWKNISKGEQYKPHNFTPENGKVVYYSPPSGYSADKNGKPTPLIGAGNAIQVSIRAFLELNTNSIYSEPAMIKLSCSQ